MIYLHAGEKQYHHSGHFFSKRSKKSKTVVAKIMEISFDPMAAKPIRIKKKIRAHRKKKPKVVYLTIGNCLTAAAKKNLVKLTWLKPLDRGRSKAPCHIIRHAHTCECRERHFCCCLAWARLPIRSDGLAQANANAMTHFTQNVLAKKLW